MTATRIQKLYCFLLLVQLFSGTSLGWAQSKQFFVTTGDNLSAVNCSEILFAPIVNQNHQAYGKGKALVRKPVDLAQPFSTQFILEFPDTTAVDGGAIIFQKDTATLAGNAWYGMGIQGIPQSVAISFDAFKNATDNDPDDVHISIQANGNTDHKSVNNLAGPISIEPFFTTTTFPPYPDVQKKFHHLVTIEWDPAAKILAAKIDNQLVISTQTDLVQKIFNGQSKVYWGFTASNTQPEWFPATKELTFGYMHFSFGNVIPKFFSQPTLDTCFGTPIRFLDSSDYQSEYGLSDIRLFKWHWNFGDGTSSSQQFPPPHIYPAAGIYQLQFAATNQIGCTSDTLTRKITLGTVPEADFDVQQACTNAPTQFIDLSKTTYGAVVNWKWKADDIAFSSGQDAFNIFTTNGSKQIALTVKTEMGCTDDTVKTIMVDDKPIVRFAMEKDCNGFVHFNANTLNNASIKEWQWRIGDRGFRQQNPVYLFNQNGTYDAALTAVSVNGCWADTVHQTISINKIFAFAGNDTTAVMGQPIQLQAMGGTTYSWSPADGLDNPFIADPIATLQADRQYRVLVKNNEGCAAADSINIKVYKGPAVYIPSAFTPDGDGLNDVFRITAAGIGTLRYFKVYDRYGQVVFETDHPNTGWDGRYKGQVLATGTYVWIVAATDFAGKKIFKRGTVVLIR